jgi:acetolactate synthase-1/2/3 large subunit
MSEFNNARMESGAGRVRVPRLPYVVESALAVLKDARQLVLVGAKVPVSFFAYPGKPSVLIPEGCKVTKVADAGDDIEGALQALADELGASRTPIARVEPMPRGSLPSGAVTAEGIAAVIAALIPEGAIVVDESVSTGRAFAAAMMDAAPHDWLNIMGGSIGWGLPVGVGAAIGAPARKVLVLEGDGSAMYTLQALWTMAREGLDVTVVIFANRSYRILHGEFANVGAGTAGRRANDMLTLDRPHLDWIALARGHGVNGARATTLDEFARELKRGLDTHGPHLVELVM